MKIGSFFKKTKYVSLNSVIAKESHGHAAELKDSGKTQAVEIKNKRLSSRDRIDSLIDEGTFGELFEDVTSKNPLGFEGYDAKREDAFLKSGIKEAVITGIGTIDGVKTAIAAMDPYYMMGSMGFGVGEKITLITEAATSQDIPLIIFAASGGARMQEGIVSLMQMAKTSAAIRRHSDSGNLYISILTDPTTGGVTASFAMQGDINASEPGALIGFAGPRVIEQTIRQKLPEGFQTAEFLEEHGMIDIIIDPSEMKSKISKLIKLHDRNNIEASRVFRGFDEIGIKTEIQGDAEDNHISAWDRVKKAREKGRLTSLEIIESIVDDFTELKGDRQFADDRAIVGGVGSFKGMPVTVIGNQKGRDLEENLKRNFGMAHPEGYRKAQRLMKQADKFNRPIICFIDTSGAFCGLGAEERGQGEAIARSLYDMAGLGVPVISIVVGEGGSGGALALGVANKVYMLSNSIYSILSPEGFSSILWKDSTRAPEAAEKMKITADDLKSLGIIDDIIPECMDDCDTINNISSFLEASLKELCQMDGQNLIDSRYAKFRAMGSDI